MAKTNGTPRTAAKKAAGLVRQGKTLTSLLTVYERMLSGELDCTQEGLEALKASIIIKTKEIEEAVLG